MIVVLETSVEVPNQWEGFESVEKRVCESKKGTLGHWLSCVAQRLAQRLEMKERDEPASRPEGRTRYKGTRKVASAVHLDLLVGLYVTYRLFLWHP